MKRIALLVATVGLCICTPAGAATGMTDLPSVYPAKATMDRLEDIVKQKGLVVFARIDHAAGAARIGKTLRPTELLIFGNPQGGTPFMECAQSVGIDLPLKALVWEDAAGKVWISYNDPAFIAQRHDVPGCPAVENLKKALMGIVDAAGK
jgi:uncharacterized protein (DUF302 family)